MVQLYKYIDLKMQDMRHLLLYIKTYSTRGKSIVQD